MSNDNNEVQAGQVSNVFTEVKPNVAIALSTGSGASFTDETIYQAGFNATKGIYTKELSYAGIIGYGSGKERSDGAEKLYMGQISNGNYRPYINDMLELMVPKGVKIGFMGSLPPVGNPIKKYKMIEACNLLINVLTASAEKKNKTIDDVVVGVKKKAFVSIARKFLDKVYSVDNGAEAVQADNEAEADALVRLNVPKK